MPIQLDKIPCNLVRSFGEVFDSNCHFYIRIPLGKNLKLINFGHLHWEDSSTFGIVVKDTVCFTDNMVETFIFSGNGKWATDGTIEYSLNRINSIIGLDNIKSFSIDRNNLNIPLDFITSNFKALTHLNLSSNAIQLKDNLTFCKI